MARMTDELVYGYAEITKTEKTPDGLMVWGKAAGSELDIDEQRCDPLWLKTAMPDWMRYGNVREQHLPIAAGVGKELAEQADGWYLKSLVVDPVTIKKVETGVLKGYSVGVKHGKVVRAANAPKGLINGGTIVEVSLVDRPANPTATMMICKAAGMGGTLLPVDEEGEVLGIGDTDIIKSARATVRGVLHEDLVVDLAEAGDIAGAKAAVDSVCDLIIHTAQMLKSASPDDTVDIADLQDAVAALGEFGDMGVDTAEFDQVLTDGDDVLVEKMLARAKAEGYLVKAALADGRDGGGDLVPATVLAAEITKAVAEVKEPLEARIASLQADLTKAMAAPIGGGPVLIAPAVQPGVTKTSEADKLRAIANNPNLAAPVAAAYRASADELEGVTA